MKNLLTEDPLTQREIDKQLAIVTLIEILGGLFALGATGFLGTVLWCAMARGLDGLVGTSTSPSNEIPWAIVGFSIAMMAIALIGMSVAEESLRFSKEELKPITGDEKVLMLGFCEKNPEIESYRRKIVVQRREFYGFELSAAIDFDKYMQAKANQQDKETARAAVHHQLYRKMPVSL